LHVIVLLEPFNRSLIGAGNSQSTVGKNSLGIVHMSENFFDAPFPRGIAIICFLLAELGEQRKGVGQLGGENFFDIVPVHERNIAVVVSAIFILIRSSSAPR